MTVPVFLQTDETAFDDPRALTAEHGRRLVRNALAIWNERCGHVGHAEQLIAQDGTELSTRVLVTAGWAYVGPWHYYCPAPVGGPNIARPTPTVRLLLSGRATGLATSYLYAINEAFPPRETQMDTDIAGSGDAWAEITTADWSATLTLRVATGWNRLWLAVKCGQYGDPVDLTWENPETEIVYPPYLGELSDTPATASSHPAVLSAQCVNRDVPAFALQLTQNASTYTQNVLRTYTCPLALENPLKNPTLGDGMWFLWEPFAPELQAIAPLFSTNFERYSDPPSLPITAYRVALDVLNLDAVTMDGSQEWTTEDYADGAGLRWWQLPSAAQYRNAANLAETGRRSVCPMVGMVNEVQRGTVPSPYPLGINDGKPYGWMLASDGGGAIQGTLLSLSELPPFALPTDTVNLEVRVSVAIACWLNRGSEVQLSCTLTLRDMSTGLGIVQATSVQPAQVMLPGAGSTYGYSVLARTMGWSIAYNRDGGTQVCQYGQEGLTLRADWPRWQDFVMVLAVPRILIPTDPTRLECLFTVNGVPTQGYLIATGAMGVRIKGL